MLHDRVICLLLTELDGVRIIGSIQHLTVVSAYSMRAPGNLKALR